MGKRQIIVRERGIGPARIRTLAIAAIVVVVVVAALLLWHPWSTGHAPPVGGQAPSAQSHR